jgi:hypothetical protein
MRCRDTSIMFLTSLRTKLCEIALHSWENICERNYKYLICKKCSRPGALRNLVKSFDFKVEALLKLLCHTENI